MPPQTRKRKAALAEPGPQSSSSSASAVAPPAATTTDTKAPAKRQKKNLPVRPDGDKNASVPARDTENKSRDHLVRFDDEGNADKELVVPTTTTAAPAGAELRGEAEGDDSDSDSDAAPEAVSTAKVAREMMESAQVAKRVAQEQAAASKKKRQQRDALFKKQALDRKDAQVADSDHRPLPAAQGRKRAERTHIPDVLPVEFLTDSSSDDDDDEERVSPGAVDALRRRMSVPSVETRLAREGRAPRDEVIGGTVYRVMKDVDGRMAPKVRKYARGTKHALLRRGREPVRGAGTGFFRRR